MSEAATCPICHKALKPDVTECREVQMAKGAGGTETAVAHVKCIKRDARSFARFAAKAQREARKNQR